MAVVFGHLESEYLALRVVGRLPTYDADEGWLPTQISVVTIGFGGDTRTDLLRQELAAFRDQLAPLYERPAGRAELRSLEAGLRADVVGDGLGNFRMIYEVRSRNWPLTALKSELEFDQTQIPGIIEQLDAVLNAYPGPG